MGSILKIDLNCIRKNIEEYKIKLGENRKFCAVVKADAYGFGSKKICREINDLVDYFAVSSEKEFFEIKNVISKPVLILDPIYENITKLAKFNCEICVSNLIQFKKIFMASKRNKNVNYKIHLKINTGMNRFGFCDFKEIAEVFYLSQKTQNIFIIGAFSHFYMGNNKDIANFQIKKFEDVKFWLGQKFDVSNIIFHISNTDGFEIGRKFDMVRIGLGMFLKHNKNCIELKSKIIEIQNVKKGETAGYSLGFIAERNMKIAVVSIGYADGILRCITGRGMVLVGGKFCKILAVCMDSIIIDITDVKTKLFDDVIVIGKSGDKQIFVCDIARWCDTIEYEILTRISKRVKRVFVGGTIHANYNRKV